MHALAFVTALLFQGLKFAQTLINVHCAYAIAQYFIHWSTVDIVCCNEMAESCSHEY